MTVNKKQKPTCTVVTTKNKNGDQIYKKATALHIYQTKTISNFHTHPHKHFL